MDFEIELTAKTTDPGGMLKSFEDQLAELGGEALLISETNPVKVESSGSFFFEAKRLYRIVL